MTHYHYQFDFENNCEIADAFIQFLVTSLIPEIII